MNNLNYPTIALNGLWHNNPIFVQMLGLCPLLAVSNTVVNALGLGLATIFVLMLSNFSISLIRNIVRAEIRLPIFVLIIASIVTAIELIMQAWFHDLYQILGIFIPLIVTNCSIVGRAEGFASKNPPLPALWDGFMTGCGFTLALILLGTMREIIGFGTFFSQAHLMFGESMNWLTIQIFENYHGFLLAILPPGAFIGLAFILAGKNIIDRKIKNIKQKRSVIILQQTSINN